MHTGDIIKNMRKRKNMTQQELADLLNVKKSSVQKYESGSVQNLKLEKLRKLCQIFEMVPFAFVFPEDWTMLHTLNEKNDAFTKQSQLYFKLTTLYFSLTEEGKQKAIDYMEDLSQIERYKNKKEMQIDIIKTPSEKN